MEELDQKIIQFIREHNGTNFTILKKEFPEINPRRLDVNLRSLALYNKIHVKWKENNGRKTCKEYYYGSDPTTLVAETPSEIKRPYTLEAVLDCIKNSGSASLSMIRKKLGLSIQYSGLIHSTLSSLERNNRIYSFIGSSGRYIYFYGEKPNTLINKSQQWNPPWLSKTIKRLNARTWEAKTEDNILTFEVIACALYKKLGDKKESISVTDRLVNLFGYSNRILDTTLTTEDRIMCYMLEEMDILKSDQEFTILNRYARRINGELVRPLEHIEDKEWTILYWVLRTDKISELSGRTVTLEPEIQKDMYGELPKDVWQKTK